MAEGILLVGMPGNLALWRLMDLKGLRMPLQALEETLLWDFSLEGMVQELRSRGFEARPIQVQAGELDHLELPTLLQLRNGNWVLLRRREPGGYRIEQGMGGSESLPLEILAEAMVGPALDLGDPLPEDGGLWLRLWRLFLRQRPLLLQAGMASFTFQLLGLLLPWLTSIALDKALPIGALNQLQLVAAGMALGALFRGWVGWLKERTLLLLATRLELGLDKSLLHHLLWLPFQQLQRRPVGELLQAFLGLGAARSQLLERGLGAVFSLAGLLLYGCGMFMLAPAQGAAALAASLLLAGLSVLVGLLQARHQKQEVQASQAQRGAMVELIQGMATLKASGSVSWGQSRWAQPLETRLDQGLRRERLDLWINGAEEFLTQGMSALMLVWGGQGVLNGTLSLGQLLAFIQLFGGFQSSVKALAQSALAFFAMRPQLLAVQEIFDQPRLPKPPRKVPRDLPGPLRAEELWFRYSPQSPWILQGRGLQVEPGRFHNLQGPSGSGKSTLLKVMAGLYEPDSGSVSVGGMDARAASKLMAYLPQFPRLLSGSIQDNLRILSGGAPAHHLQEVAKDTGLGTWVGTLPMGFHTHLAEGGGNLSGGQRQLIAITAVLASSKPLLLLDEALSNLDWLGREQVLRSRYFEGRTVVYASPEEVLRG